MKNGSKRFHGNHFKKSLQSHKALAQERTILANERNTLAYIRTGFASFVMGIALLKLFDENVLFVYGGWLSVLMGAVFILLGLIYHPLRKKRIRSY